MGSWPSAVGRGPSAATTQPSPSESRARGSASKDTASAQSYQRARPGSGSSPGESARCGIHPATCMPAAPAASAKATARTGSWCRRSASTSAPASSARATSSSEPIPLGPSMRAPVQATDRGSRAPGSDSSGPWRVEATRSSSSGPPRTRSVSMRSSSVRQRLPSWWRDGSLGSSISTNRSVTTARACTEAHARCGLRPVQNTGMPGSVMPATSRAPALRCATCRCAGTVGAR